MAAAAAAAAASAAAPRHRHEPGHVVDAATDEIAIAALGNAYNGVIIQFGGGARNLPMSSWSGGSQPQVDRTMCHLAAAHPHILFLKINAEDCAHCAVHFGPAEIPAVFALDCSARVVGQAGDNCSIETLVSRVEEARLYDVERPPFQWQRAMEGGNHDCPSGKGNGGRRKSRNESTGAGRGFLQQQQRACPLCQEPFAPPGGNSSCGDAMRLETCGHILCGECWQLWMISSRALHTVACPVCQRAAGLAVRQPSLVPAGPPLTDELAVANHRNFRLCLKDYESAANQVQNETAAGAVRTVEFSMRVKKVTSTGRTQVRYLVATSCALYVFNWTYRKPVRRIPLRRIESALQGDGKLFFHVTGERDAVYVSSPKLAVCTALFGECLRE